MADESGERAVPYIAKDVLGAQITPFPSRPICTATVSAAPRSTDASPCSGSLSGNIAATGRAFATQKMTRTHSKSRAHIRVNRQQAV